MNVHRCQAGGTGTDARSRRRRGPRSRRSSRGAPDKALRGVALLLGVAAVVAGCEQGAPRIEDSAMVRPVARDEPRPRPALTPSVEESEEPAETESGLRADLYADLSLHVTAVVEALPQGARLAVAPVYGPEEPEEARALTDLIATLAHRNGAALIHPAFALVAFDDFGFAPSEVEDSQALYDFGSRVGAAFVVVPRVPHWQGEVPRDEQNLFELHVYDVAAQQQLEEATRRVTLSFDTLASPRRLRRDELRGVHSLTVELAQLQPLGLDVALLVRDSFAAAPREVELGEPLSEGQYVKLFVRANRRARLFAAGMWEDGTLVPLSGDPVGWGSLRDDEEIAETLARYETPLEAGEKVELPQASWIRLKRGGRLALVLEARVDVEPTRWFVPPGSRAFVGTRPVLWLREQETRERMALSLERQQAALTQGDSEAQSPQPRGTDWAATWRRAAADRRRELVLWANALARLATAEAQTEVDGYPSRLPDPLPYVAAHARKVPLESGQRFRLVGEDALTLERPGGEVLEGVRVPDRGKTTMRLDAHRLVLHRTPRSERTTPEEMRVEPHQAAGLRGAVVMLELTVREKQE